VGIRKSDTLQNRDKVLLLLPTVGIILLKTTFLLPTVGVIVANCGHSIKKNTEKKEKCPKKRG